ncbi:hypothetical protein CO2235_MP40082 [Cupriavidus oxalaticus]|uniref:Uncharacterized protein n=1 Tax=Cupriavidus oxalaticus TaxID=96344 RepID=A0A976BI81_9BURK|nr:hypothetical protein CO2235_MP40082 [Cupriavidus oxalaticus]
MGFRTPFTCTSHCLSRPRQPIFMRFLYLCIAFISFFYRPIAKLQAEESL